LLVYRGAGIFGRELPADAPAKYREDYLLAPSSISPNKKLALIYRKEGNEFPTRPESRTADNYLITLDPFRILGSLPVAYFENINHKGLSVNWAKDSSGAVIASALRGVLKTFAYPEPKTESGAR